MKKLIYVAVIASLLAACSNEDDTLTNSIIYEKGFVITDNPADPVQHERYLIYQEYNIPVYFNDTISAKEIGKDWYGNPIVRYETVDLSWSFTSYDHGVKYEYDYLTTQEQQIVALKFIRKYLDICSKPMRPFSIMAADTLRVVSDKETKKPTYKVGFRTLVFTQLTDITEDKEIEAMAHSVIKEMVKDKIAVNKNLCAKFKAISDEKKAYGTSWEKLGNCPVTIEWIKKNPVKISTNYLFYGDPYISLTSTTKNTDFVDTVLNLKLVKTKEEAITYRSAILQEIGTYGFIAGAAGAGLYTPGDDDNDRNDFISAILYLGADGFAERYGASTLVMKKYAILYEYIMTELGIQL